LRLRLALLVLAGCGYAPRFENCAIQCQDECPEGMSCSGGYCAAGGVTCGADAAPTSDAEPSTARDGLVFLWEGPGGSGAAALFSGSLLYGGPQAGVGVCAFYQAPASVGASVGSISIAGTTAPFELTPVGAEPMVGYTAPTLPGDLFADDALIYASAPGEDVPAFDAMVQVPPPIAGVTMPPSISRRSPVGVEWTPNGADEIWVTIGASSETGGFSLIWCRASDSDALVVPAELIAMLPLSATTAGIVVQAANISTVTAGSWSIEVAAGTRDETTVPIVD
jgi:hypothetical protein